MEIDIMNNWIIVAIVLLVMMIAFLIFNAVYGRGVVPAVTLGISDVFLMIAIAVNMTCAKRSYEKQKIRYEYVMQVIENMDNYDYANAGITQTVLEYNEWLTDAKANKTSFGRWSFYTGIPIEDLEFIGVKNSKT